MGFIRCREQKYIVAVAEQDDCQLIISLLQEHDFLFFELCTK
jgi:hypothetical protein